jgi:competence protein ComEC
VTLYSLEVKPPRAPLFLAALFFSAGILFARYSTRPSAGIVGAIAVFFVAAAFFLTRRREQVAYALALLVVTSLGFLALEASDLAETAAAQAASLARFTTGEEITITAHVIKSPPSLGPAIERTVLDLVTEALDDGAGPIALQSGIRLSIYQRGGNIEDEEPAQLPLLYGDRVRFVARLREPRNFGTPGAWDYAGYLRQQGIFALGSTRSDRVGRLPERCGTRYGFWRDRGRRSVMKMMHRLWPEQQTGLMDAMLIGERAFVERPMSVDFQRSGTYHILVVSGMNVGILAFVIFWTMRRLRSSERLASTITIILSLGYAYLCDSGAPILRSVAMISLYLIGRLFFRDRSSLNVVGAAALFVLLVDPHGLFDASFQLTFLSVAAIPELGYRCWKEPCRLYSRRCGISSRRLTISVFSRARRSSAWIFAWWSRVWSAFLEGVSLELCCSLWWDSA